MFPFSETIEANKKIRKFSKDVDEEELIWHRDKKSRKVTVVASKGWYLQFDDQLPVELVEGETYYIPKESWHRVIKKTGHGDLIVSIFEE